MPTFFHDARARDERCGEKDAIVERIIQGLDVHSPSGFHAIMMPGLYGPELSLLGGRGVPMHNIWAIERDPEVHKRMRRMYPRLKTTPSPQDARDAIDHIEAVAGHSFDFIYLDFYGVPDRNLLSILRKIFVLKIMSRPGTLMVTCGKTRCKSLYGKVNSIICERLSLPLAIPRYIEVAQADAYRARIVSSDVYDSRAGNNRRIRYVTTVARY